MTVSNGRLNTLFPRVGSPGRVCSSPRNLFFLHARVFFESLVTASVSMSLRVLIIGSGGREHALAWRLSRSDLVDHVFVCPGNGGTLQEAKTTNVDVSATDFPALVQFSVGNGVRSPSSDPRLSLTTLKLYQVTLVLPGPEQPLVDGVESYFRKGNSHWQV